METVNKEKAVVYLSRYSQKRGIKNWYVSIEGQGETWQPSLEKLVEEATDLVSQGYSSELVQLSGYDEWDNIKAWLSMAQFLEK